MAQTLTGRAARLEDVAALAGVSLATASKALHNKPRISEETKQRVLDAARQLNYSPNKLAQSLARGTTGTIGLVTSDLQGRFSTPILIGAENELRAQSTSVLLANARDDAALERQHVEKLLSLKVDGLLIVQCETNPRPTLGHDWGVPLVYVSGPSTDPKDCSVTCDNVDAGRMAINHLISCGRRHIAIIGGDETYTAATDGAFDITIAPLVSLWGITTDSPHIPTQQEIDVLLPLVGPEHLHLSGDTVTLDDGCAIDLGGIAKGYASDRVAAIFARHGITSGTISLGGNVYVCGSKPNGQPWVVAIQDPRSDGYAVTVALTDSFAVTSGGYQRYYTAPDGTVYQHILDPKTGYPVESDLLSVSILCDNGTMADAYSTALYVMGSAGAQAFWRTHGGFEMILITTAGQVLYTPGLSEKITPTEGSGYEYVSIHP